MTPIRKSKWGNAVSNNYNDLASTKHMRKGKKKINRRGKVVEGSKREQLYIRLLVLNFLLYQLFKSFLTLIWCAE